MICQCTDRLTYDLDQPTGRPDDVAVCKEGDFFARGVYAGHEGMHHNLATGHGWTLHRKCCADSPATARADLAATSGPRDEASWLDLEPRDLFLLAVLTVAAGWVMVILGVFGIGPLGAR